MAVERMRTSCFACSVFSSAACAVPVVVAVVRVVIEALSELLWSSMTMSG